MTARRGGDTITVGCTFGTFWITKVEAAVSVKVGPAKAALEGGAGGTWTKLFADEAWYKRRKGEERSFMGTLQAVPGRADRRRSCERLTTSWASGASTRA